MEVPKRVLCKSLMYLVQNPQLPPWRLGAALLYNPPSLNSPPEASLNLAQRVQVPNTSGLWSQIPRRVWLLEPLAGHRSEQQAHHLEGPQAAWHWADPVKSRRLGVDPQPWSLYSRVGVYTHVHIYVYMCSYMFVYKYTHNDVPMDIYICVYRHGYVLYVHICINT